MIRRIISLGVTWLAMANALAGSLDDLAPMLGHWESPDGTSRVSFESRFGGNWIDSRMWFRAGDGWELVGQGAIYRQPTSGRYVSVMRTTGMQDIVLFESTIWPVDDGYAVANVGIRADGSRMETTEDWTFPAPDRFDYTIYRLQGDERKPWYRGAWVRRVD